RTIEQVADPVNANARGAGMLAAVALGELTFDEVPGRVAVSASYRPDPRTAGLYTVLYEEFVGLYRNNRKAHARLNGPWPVTVPRCAAGLRSPRAGRSVTATGAVSAHGKRPSHGRRGFTPEERTLFSISPDTPRPCA